MCVCVGGCVRVYVSVSICTWCIQFTCYNTDSDFYLSFETIFFCCSCYMNAYTLFVF